MKTKEEIIAIALEDAGTAYHDLSVYQVEATPDGTLWKVVFAFKQPGMLGGGPYYEIDGNDGAILHRMYYQ